MSARSRISLALAAVVVTGGLVAVSSRVAHGATTVQYTYDADGRLHSVTNATPSSATYAYDSVGNVTSIIRTGAATPKPVPAGRPTSSPPSVTTLSPSQVAPGAEVTITGTGFASRPGDNVVKVGSLMAQVVSATPTRLVVIAPPGRGGRVEVSTPGGRATGKAVSIGAPLSAAPAGATGAPSKDPASRAALSHPRVAGAGITALSGLVARNDGQPLAGVHIAVNNVWDPNQTTTTTDKSGWFVLPDLTAGSHVLSIDGGADRFGYYSEPLEVASGRTTVLPWITYLTPLDLGAAITFPSPTTSDLVLTSPKLPGLEVQIPAGTVIHDVDGTVVRHLSLTALTVDRTPFPWAASMVPPLFSLQPGGATVSGSGLRIIYPNYSGQPPGTPITFLAEDPSWSGTGWSGYGTGHVSADGRSITPDQATAFHTTAPGGYQTPGPPQNGPPPGPPCNCADPVNLATGLQIVDATDIQLPDVLAANLTRTYRQLDNTVRDFGIGMSDSFSTYAFLDNTGNFQVVLPDGERIVYLPTSTTHVYAAQSTPTQYVGSTLTLLTGDQFGPLKVALKDGTTLGFGDPAFLTSITDHFGNTVTISRTNDPFGRIRQVTTPDGRWLSFTFGSCVASSSSTQCVTSVSDNIGRTINYSYDANGRLVGVADANGGHSSYTWAACTTSVTCTEMLTAADPVANRSFSDSYDPASGRVTSQTAADGGIWQYSYVTNTSGSITQTNVTDPRGTSDTFAFNPHGYESAQTLAVGTTVAQTSTPVYDPTTNLVTKVTDGLGRVTTYSYDALGNVTSMVQNAGTSQASTSAISYEPNFNRVASYTDPLGHVTSASYNDSTPTITVTDPVGAKTLVTLNRKGQPVGWSDPLRNQTYFSYYNGDLVAVADPAGDVSTAYRDGVGRLLQSADPQGNSTAYAWNPLDEILSMTDPLGNVTRYTYDGAGQRRSITDGNGGTSNFAYNNMRQLSSDTDPLGNAQSYAYDQFQNLVSTTDRNGTVSTFTYDALNRRTLASYGVVSGVAQKTVGYSYDAANRVTQAVDSAAGTYALAYDNLDDIVVETQPAGRVTSAYDLAGRTTALTVSGQTPVTYRYNSDDSLTSITKSGASVRIAYDAGQRPIATTFPDGIVRQVTYDVASRPTAINFSHGTTQLGALDYAYDANSRITGVSGSLAATNIPAAAASLTYNADNELVSSGGTTLSYDKQGNLLSDGTRTYTWNAQRKLSAMAGTTTASFVYDPWGRRSAATIAGQNTSFVYAGLDVVQTLSGTTPTANMIVGDLNQTFQIADSGGTSSVLTDSLGSTIGLGNASGAIATTYTYDPFGATTTSGAADPNTLQYIGAQNDGTGLYYLNARYYSPSTQRFISQDPIGFDGGATDLYQYALNDPINSYDPLGLEDCKPPKELRRPSPLNEYRKTANEVAGDKSQGKVRDLGINVRKIWERAAGALK